jgi:hypothetical protein
VSGLDEMSREELLALVLAQAKTIEALTQRVAELERQLAAGLAVGAVTGCLLCGFIGEVSAHGDHALPPALATTSSGPSTVVGGSIPFKIEYVAHTHSDAESVDQLNTITAAPSGSPTSRRSGIA